MDTHRAQPQILTADFAHRAAGPFAGGNGVALIILLPWSPWDRHRIGRDHRDDPALPAPGVAL